MRWPLLLLLLLLAVVIDGWSYRPRWSARKLPKYKEVVAVDENSGQSRSFLVREDVLEKSGVHPHSQGTGNGNGDGAGRIEPLQLQEWLAAGWGFPFTEEGIKQLEMAERRERMLRKRRAVLRRPLQLEAYLNRSIAGERVMVRMDAIAQLQDSPEHLEALVKQGRAFYNYSALVNVEQQRRRAQATAEMLSADPTLQSPPWKRFNNVSAQHDASSLLNAISEYVSDSQGRHPDTGARSEYVRRPGYVGTMPPGETFEEADSAESLPKKVVHPWPALQEIPYSVRWPVPHPFIPPPALFLALNDMYTDAYKAEARRRRSPLVAGSFLDAYDAIRLAARGDRGRAYDPAEQLQHGGMRYDAWQLPHYEADHGPTVSAQEARVDLPAALRDRLESSPSPREAGGGVVHVVGSAQQQREAEDEARWRAERLAALRPRRALADDADDDDDDDSPKGRQAVEDDVARRVAAFVDRNRRGQAGDGSAAAVRVAELCAPTDAADACPPPAVVRVVDLDAVLRRRAQRVQDKVRRQVAQRRSVLAAARGQVRDPQAVLDYVVETVRGIEDELATRAGGEVFAQRRSNRKRMQRLRRRIAHEEADPEDAALGEAAGGEAAGGEGERGEGGEGGEGEGEGETSPLADFFDEMADT